MGTRQGITHFQTSAFPPFESEDMMTKDIDRCTRIAELLLIENEAKKLEKASNVFNITDTIFSIFDYEEDKGVEMTPIEKLMYAILTRVADEFYECYGQELELGISCQQQIGQYRVDFLVTATFSDDKVIIECDGHDFHEKTKEQAKHDKERDRYLTSQGYKILRYTGSEIYNDFIKIERELSDLLDVPVSKKSLFSERRNAK